MRSLAERARGLAATSAASGSIALRVTSAKRGRLGGRLRGVAAAARRGAGAELEEALDDAVLERVEGHDREPAAGRERRLGGGEAAGELAELVVDRDAQRLEAAGRGDAAGRASCRGSRRSIRPASCSVVAKGARRRSATMARAMRREARSSPYWKSRSASAASGRPVDEVGGASGRPGSSACRAARPSGRRSRAPAWSSCIEETPTSSTTPSSAGVPRLGGDAVERAEGAGDEVQAAGEVAGPGGGAVERLGVAVDADHPGRPGLEQRPGVAAGAEGAVEPDAPRPGRPRARIGASRTGTCGPTGAIIMPALAVHGVEHREGVLVRRRARRASRRCRPCRRGRPRATRSGSARPCRRSRPRSSRPNVSRSRCGSTMRPFSSTWA